MLDTDTKRRIDSCRDILVGKVPDPKSQVEQITIALIYKFMDDMDRQSVEMGGKPSFFTGNYKKYAWSQIFDPKLGGFERINLYGEALVQMNHNPNIPQLFRDIFKNAFLPYRDPETLKSFLKEINNFNYDHSEKLGDAFEYLLSVLGSQGDAGQFRTPRHIIDFITAVVAPRANEIVLDPACGTAGFLISAYKHIVKHNPKLSSTQKKKLIHNFIGYDISPDMVRLSLVNMYLHGFVEPHIHEYDTLTSEDRWDDTADVILANPPFMSPKGGIKPHKRFSIPAKRSEVLFVDYIAEHLTPQGRGGVIVPEGIIFQAQTAHKSLRKMLIDQNFLWAVISLPAGVFQPYSGVKTSILLMDRQLAKQTDKILFVKIENDGRDLGAQRREIEGSQLPAALEFINGYKAAIATGKDITDGDLAHTVAKEEILASDDISLSGDRYRDFGHHYASEWPMVELQEIAKIDWGNTELTKKAYDPEGDFLGVSAAGADGKMTHYEHEAGVTVISAIGANCGRVFYLDKKFTAIKNTMTVTPNPEKVLPLFLFNLMNQNKLPRRGGGQPFIAKGDVLIYKIPLPPLEVQETIVAEIDGYQKVIDGARQVVEHYKPTIKINPDWPMVELKEVAGIKGGFAFKSSEFAKKGIQVIKMGNVKMGHLDLDNKPSYMPLERIHEFEDYIISEGDILITMTGTQGKRDFGEVCFINGDEKYLLNQRVGKVEYDNKKISGVCLALILSSPIYQDEIFTRASGVRQANISGSKLEEIKIPLPPLDEQQRIVAEIEAEQGIVAQNKKLIELFEQKIQTTIAAIWGEKQENT